MVLDVREDKELGGGAEVMRKRCGKQNVSVNRLSPEYSTPLPFISY